jgi:hypothetical protein
LTGATWEGDQLKIVIGLNLESDQRLKSQRSIIPSLIVCHPKDTRPAFTGFTAKFPVFLSPP